MTDPKDPTDINDQNYAQGGGYSTPKTSKTADEQNIIDTTFTQIPTPGDQILKSNIQKSQDSQSTDFSQQNLASAEDLNNVVIAPHTPKKYGGRKIIATIFGIVFLVAAVTVGVYLVQQQQRLQQMAASGKECEQSPDCVLLDKPGNQGSFDAPKPITHVIITDKDIHKYGPGETDDGCRRVIVLENYISWNKYRDGPDCKDVSNVQVWMGQSQSSPTPTPKQPEISCPLESQPGRVIVILNPSGEIYSDRGQQRANFGPVTTNIPAGNYKVTLVSYDNHSEHNPPQNQPKEQWYLITNTSGNTGTINDLPESDDWLTQVVNQNFSVTSTITSVVAHHAAYPDTTSPNSITPVCAAFDDVGSPSATPTPPFTPLPTPTSPPGISAQCLEVKTYDTQWNLLTKEDLENLKPQDTVRFAVSGQASSGTFDKARFTVNGQGIGETSTQKPGSDEFYIEYTIPDGIADFEVKGEVHHSSLGWM